MSIASDFLNDFQSQLELNSKNYLSEKQGENDLAYYFYLVEYGNADAIKFSSILLKYTDASLTMGVYNSLARGLIKNPQVILTLPNIENNLHDICTVPFFDAPLDIETIHINQAIWVLKNVSLDTKTGKKNKKDCLAIFNGISKNIR